MIDTPRHRRSRATTSSAARHIRAWLSPSSATVARLRRRATPNAQGSNARVTRRVRRTRHGELGVTWAAAGRGKTMWRRAGLWQARRGSREAAPKQRGCSGAGAAGTAGAAAPSAPPIVAAIAARRQPAHVFCW